MAGLASGRRSIRVWVGVRFRGWDGVRIWFRGLDRRRGRVRSRARTIREAASGRRRIGRRRSRSPGPRRPRRSAARAGSTAAPGPSTTATHPPRTMRSGRAASRERRPTPATHAGSPNTVTPPISIPVIRRVASGGANDALRVPSRSRTARFTSSRSGARDDASGVTRRVALADDEDRVRRLLRCETVGRTEGRGVGEGRVAREQLVVDTQRRQRGDQPFAALGIVRPGRSGDVAHARKRNRYHRGR